jgi:hypothetical protein
MARIESLLAANVTEGTDADVYNPIEGVEDRQADGTYCIWLRASGKPVKPGQRLHFHRDVLLAHFIAWEQTTDGDWILWGNPASSTAAEDEIRAIAE